MAKITFERLTDAVERQTFGLDNPGFCLACGYECDECGEHKVYGTQVGL